MIALQSEVAQAITAEQPVAVLLEAQRMIRGLRGVNLVGGDVVEVAPPFDPSGATALVGATLMYEILCLLAEIVANR